MSPGRQRRKSARTRDSDEGDIFVSLEGIDFTGKTTIVRKLGRELRALGVHPLLVADPPLMSPWRDIKRDLLDRRNPMAAPAESLIYLAGRVDSVVRTVRPALDEGRVVVADRFLDSWVAYWAPELAANFGSLGNAISWLTRIEANLRSRGMGALPSRTYLLLDDPREACKRSPQKTRTKWEKVQTLARVQDVYAKLARRDPDRIRVFDIRSEGLKPTAERVVDDAVSYICELAGL